MKIAYFDCFSGISGDMTLGALVDIGLDQAYLVSELLKLKLNGYNLSFSNVKRHGVSGTKAKVDILHHDESDKHHHGRHLSDIKRLIEESELSDDIKQKSISMFVHLGQAEAKVHNVDIEEVHFHEVGAIDSIIDIVGSAIGITALNIGKIYSSPLPLGGGFTKSSHGVIPIPAPATVELLRGIPIRETNIQSELVTPTGAAIISTLADGFGPIPEMTIENIGYGAGSKDFNEQPNMLRIILGENQDSLDNDSITVIETNIDDMSPQLYDLLMDKLFELGALDVFLTPIIMKKNRPAIKLTVILDQSNIQEACICILKETTTMGLRIYETKRKKLSREMRELKTKYGTIRVKLGKIGDEVIKVIPEYDDCKKLAIEHNVSITHIHQLAINAFLSENT
ncbi:MAG: nickel pincer cofactor biosynthesis protein LarC [bacterium]